MMNKMLTGVLSVGLLAGTGGVVSENETIETQEGENKYFTHTEVEDGESFYGYVYDGVEILSKFALTQAEMEQITMDKTELEQAQAPGIPVDSFKGTIHEDEETAYSYEHEGVDISSEIPLRQEEIEQITIDELEQELELAQGIPAASFKGTIHSIK